VGRRPEPIDARTVIPGQRMIFSTECEFRLDQSFRKVAKFQFFRVFRRARQIESREV
jgi:hypothetical protein